MGDRIGASASRDLAPLAAGDREPFVSRMAQSYLDQWSAAKGD